MSCRHSRQSKEMDSVYCATSAPGPPANRPLRETGDVFFMSVRLNVLANGPKVTRESGGRGAVFGVYGAAGVG